MNTVAEPAAGTPEQPVALTVSELDRLLRDTVRSNPILSRVLVRGETSNVQRTATGLAFFTLRDDEAQIACVLFRSLANGLPFELADGMAVLVTGDVDVYARRGEVQLVIHTIAPEGVGLFWASFQKTKKALEEEGLFAAPRKRPLPTFPQRIGLVTSEHGAAVHDLVTILRRRYPLAAVVLSPSLVQGAEAPASLRHALADVQDRVDVVIVARGGGSLEDLWCFNDEGLVRAIAACPVPVISAVGHETDVTIVDFVADVRAPTPSAAAELASPDVQEIRRHILSLAETSLTTMRDLLRDRRRGLAMAGGRLSPASLLQEVREDRDILRRLGTRLLDGAARILRTTGEHLASLDERLDAVSPLGTLRRGYAIVEREDGHIVTEARTVDPSAPLVVRLRDGRLHVHVDSKEEDEP